MAEASFLAAFVGGLLSLLAPCSGLLLPAFFAYAFTSPTQLLGRTAIFLAGMCSVVVPLGLGASLVGALLLDYRDATVVAAGLMLIVFGIMELSGRGFSLLPPQMAGRLQRGESVVAVYGTGLVYGISGFCAGPLVGSVLALAASAADPVVGAALLFTYSIGAAAPLFVIAWLWDRYRLGQRRWLRGRPVQLGRFEIHSTNLIAGALFMLLGVSFIGFQGSSVLAGLYDDLGITQLGYAAQEWLANRLVGVADGLWIGLGLLALGVLWLARRARKLRV